MPLDLNSNISLSLQYVEQSELEAADGVSMGKYTIGLGQTKMSICDDREGNEKLTDPNLERDLHDS